MTLKSGNYSTSPLKAVYSIGGTFTEFILSLLETRNPKSTIALVAFKPYGEDSE